MSKYDWLQAAKLQESVYTTTAANSNRPYVPAVKRLGPFDGLVGGGTDYKFARGEFQLRIYPTSIYVGLSEPLISVTSATQQAVAQIDLTDSDIDDLITVLSYYKTTRNS